MKFQTILILLSLACAASLFLILYYPGISVNPDSVYYISVARNLSIGNGLTGYDGYPLLLQPPLYPFILFVLYLLHPDFLMMAGIFNALLFGGTIYVSGLLLLKYLHSVVSVTAGILLIITSSVLLKIYLSALSEPLFIFLSLLFLYYIEEYFTKYSPRFLILLSLISAAAIMTRYIGIVFPAVAIIRFLIDKERFSRKNFYRIITYSLISLSPVIIWVVRNYIISHSIMGSRAASSFTFSQNILLSFNFITEWFRLPEYNNGYLIPAGVFISCLMVIIYLFKRKIGSSPLIRLPVSLITYIILYLIILITSSSMFAYDRIGDRLLSPVFIPLIIALVSVADKVLIKRVIYFKIAAAIGVLLLINFSIQKFYFLINDYQINSSWEYSGKLWSDNNVINFLEKMDKSKYRFYSNAPDAVYFFTKKETRWSPLKTYYNSETAVNKNQSLYEIKKPEKKYLIWFDNVRRPFLYSKTELLSIVHLKKIAKFKDGEIFEMSYN